MENKKTLLEHINISPAADELIRELRKIRESTLPNGSVPWRIIHSNMYIKIFIPFVVIRDTINIALKN